MINLIKTNIILAQIKVCYVCDNESSLDKHMLGTDVIFCSNESNLDVTYVWRRSTSSASTRIHALKVLLNMISKEPVRMKLQQVGGLGVLVEQLKPPNNEVSASAVFSH